MTTFSYFDENLSDSYNLTGDRFKAKVTVGYTIKGHRVIRILEYHGPKIPRRLIDKSIVDLLITLFHDKTRKDMLKDWSPTDLIRCKVEFESGYYKGEM